MDFQVPLIQSALEKCRLNKTIKNWDWVDKTFIIKELQLLNDPLWDFDKFLEMTDIHKVSFDTGDLNIITLSARALESMEFEFRGNQEYDIYCSRIHNSTFTTTGRLNIHPPTGHLYMNDTTIQATQLDLNSCRVMKMKSNTFKVKKVVLRQMAGALLREFEAWYQEPDQPNPLNKLGFGDQMDIRKVQAYGRNSDLDVVFTHTDRNEWVGRNLRDEYDAMK